MNKSFLFVLLAFLLLWSSAFPSTVHALASGSSAPFFRIESVDGDILDLDMVRGKVVVIFYETVDVTRKNAAVKDKLNDVYDAQPESLKHLIVRLPVFNLSTVRWPLSSLYRESLKKHARRLNMKIYTDSDGAMFSAYHMEDRESNILMIDKKGIIRFSKTGKIDDNSFSEIKDLLNRLVNLE